MTSPKFQNSLCKFIRLVNYDHKIWQNRSHTLQPLTILTPKNLKCKWTDIKQKAFGEIQQNISYNTLLAYPYFNVRFDLRTDAGDSQMRADISQGFHSICFTVEILPDPRQGTQ